MTRSKTRRRLSKRFRARLLFAARFVSVVLVCTFLVTSQEQRAAIAQALADPMAVLSGRSPGERQATALRPTKVRHDMTLPKGEKLPSEGRVVDEKDVVDQIGFFADDAPAPLPAEAGQLSGNGQAPVDEMPAFAHHGGANGYFGGGGGGSIIGGGGGTNPGCIPGDKCGEGSTIPTGEPVPPTTIIGVPEPATWAMVLVGFFALGAIIRRAGPAKAAHGASRLHRVD